MSILSDKEKELLLSKAVIGLFQKKNASFLSVIYCGLVVKWDDDGAVVPTACVDGTTLTFNTEWYSSLSQEMRVTVLAHELWHVALFHCDPGRFLSYDEWDWNVACDHAINLMLKEHAYVFEGPHLADEQFTGMSAEQIYPLIAGQQQDNPFGSDISAAPDKATVQEVKELVVRAATVARMDSTWKDLPGTMKETLEALLNPKLPWENLLSKFLTERADTGYTWSRPNRRFRDIYMPSRKSNTGGLDHLVWAIDVSASVTTEQANRFLTEINKAHSLYRPKRITVITFDTEIHDTYEFGPHDKVTNLDITGRGWTDMECVMQFTMKEKPAALVVFSDLMCDVPTDPGIPTLFVCLDNPYGTMPFGRVIHTTS